MVKQSYILAEPAPGIDVSALARPQALAALGAALLPEIWDRCKNGEELAYGPRDYNAGSTLVTPGRRYLTRMVGPNWEEQTTPHTVWDHFMGQVNIDEVLAHWLRISIHHCLPNTKEPFHPPKNRRQIVPLLIAAGYLRKAERGKVQWTGEAQSPLIEAGAWTEDGCSTDDRREAGLRAMKVGTLQKARGLLEEMPPDFAEAYRDAAGDGLFASYDWLCLYYGPDGWGRTPRTLDAPSASGRPIVPAMGLSVAAQMYQIVIAPQRGDQ